MQDLIFLWLANILVWVGISGYLIFLGRCNKSIDKRLEQLEAYEYEQDEFQ